MAVQYESVIGLEVHCQLETASKLFSACPLEIGAAPNTRTDAYSWGLPGTLPVPNEAAIESAIALALATRCTVHSRSKFARKHYFYPDLPKGYQITQADEPYATGGEVEIPGFVDDSGNPQRVRLTRIHVEEDAGKNIHAARTSGVDYNRAGAPLVEIVSEPDLRSAEQAAAYMRELRTLVRALGISQANMEEGTLRCDANVSLRPVGSDTLGVRCEIKNVNSFRFLARAIEAEIRRQTDLLAHGEAVERCTLGYDHERDRLFVMRTKEDAADYRFLPDPDLPVLVIDDAWVDDVRKRLPPLPAARRERWRGLGVSAADAALLASERDLADYFDAVIEHAGSARARRASSWVTTEVLGRLEGASIASCPVPPAALAEIVVMVDDDVVSGRGAKEVLDRCWAGEGSPAAIVDARGLRQVSDTAAIDAIVAAVLAENPRQLALLRGGKDNLRGFFVGQIIKRSGGQANPRMVGERLDAALAITPEPS
jgi:aspartyl-tRNA(Asn)/glutamyl-tRNA(Gln) amidotransferase subunit B